MATTVARPQRRTAPTPRPASRPAPLRVVRPGAAPRAVGAIGTMVAGFFFLVLFALAGLHAVVVQTQAQLDGIHAEIATLEENRVHALAERARFDSPVGLAEVAAAAGLVQSDNPVLLPPVAPGSLPAPPVPDPFGPEGTDATGPADPSTTGGAAG